MKDDPHLRELLEKRSFLTGCLGPLDHVRQIGEDTPVNEARLHFLRRQIADLDAIIASEAGRGG